MLVSPTPGLGRAKASPLQHQHFSSPKQSSSLGQLLPHARVPRGEAAAETNPSLRWLGRLHPGSVCLLPVHTEAVDAGVLRVAPIAQHPQLHQLVRAHAVTLGRQQRENLSPSQPWSAPRPPQGPFSPWDWALQGQSTYLQVKCLDGITIVVVGELPKKVTLLLSLLLQALQKGRETEMENRD